MLAITGLPPAILICKFGPDDNSGVLIFGLIKTETGTIFLNWTQERVAISSDDFTAVLLVQLEPPKGVPLMIHFLIAEKYL